MSVSLLLVTHPGIGRAMLDTASRLMDGCPLPADVVDIEFVSNPRRLEVESERKLAELDQGGGVLVLTDLYGATPSNIVCRLSEFMKCRVVSGLSLPMLLRIFNYPKLPLDALAEKAASGGRDGIIIHNSP